MFFLEVYSEVASCSDIDTIGEVVILGIVSVGVIDDSFINGCAKCIISLRYLLVVYVVS